METPINYRLPSHRANYLYDDQLFQTFYPSWIKIRLEIFLKTEHFSELMLNALSRAMSRFATEPRREGQAALVHLKNFLRVS